MLHRMNVWNLGRMSYGEALAVQTRVATHIKECVSSGTNPCGALLLVEHDPVYTIGLRTKQYTTDDEVKLKTLGAEFYRTDRGGLITFHGPGQLVVYPIVNLRQFKPSVKWYVSALETVIIDLCKVYGLEARTSPDTGVWIRDSKVCAIGVHGSRFVMTHGLALNCNTDLGWFSHIVPCGLVGKGVTSLTNELGKIITPTDVLPTLYKCFSAGFNCQLEPAKLFTNVDDILRLI